MSTSLTALDKLADGGFSIGLELPLDNDWSPAGDAKRQHDGRRPGVPDLARHATLAQRADTLGFRALWVRDVPVYDPTFGDAAQVFEPSRISATSPASRTTSCSARRPSCCRCASRC
jgi:hypothetical protein